MTVKCRKIMLLLLVLVVMVFTACNTAAAPREPIEKDAVEPMSTSISSHESITIRYVSGEVFVLRGDEDLALSEGDRLYAGDELRTGADGLVIAVLSGGKQLHISEHTQLAVSVLEATDENQNTVLSLESGTVISVINEELRADDRYEVETPELIMAIRGTVASVSHDLQTDHSDVTFFDGKGIVSARKSVDVAEVSVGESVTVDAGRLDRISAQPTHLNAHEQRFLFDDDYWDLLDAEEAAAATARLNALLNREDFLGAKRAYLDQRADGIDNSGTHSGGVDSSTSSSSAASFTLDDAKAAFSARYPNTSITTAKREGNVYYVEGREGSTIYKMKFSVSDGSVVLDLTIPTGRR